MAVMEGDEIDVICIEEAACLQVVGQIIDVDDKWYSTYDRALGDVTYGLNCFGKRFIGVHLKCSSAEETFDPTYYNGGSAASSEFS